MSPELTSDLLGGAILAGIFLALLGAAELWRRFGNPDAEWTRKLVHLGGGLACLFFPFLVSSLVIVFVLAAAMTAIFAAGAHFGLLRSLHGVKRRTRGAEYYPLTIFLLLVITQGEPWRYVAAVLVLAVGDACAALVGTFYGVVRYGVDDSQKTLEGSLAFFVIAFLAIHLPTLLMTDLPRPICVLAAVLVAVLVTFFEAISLKGADNLFVPLAVAVVLDKITEKTLAEVVFQNLSLLGICLGTALLVRRLPFFNVGSTMALILFAYGGWSLGSWRWALPAFGGLVLYLLVWGQVALREETPMIRVGSVVRALLAPFALVALANGLRSHEIFFGAYLGTSATVLALALARPLFQLPSYRRGRRRLGVLLLTLLGGAATVLPAWAFLPGMPGWVVPAIVLAVLPPVALVVGREIAREGAPANGWTAPRLLASFAVGGVILALEQTNWLPGWPV